MTDWGDEITLIQFAGGGPVGAPAYLGSDNALALGEPSKTFDERIKRCYELAGFAVAFGEAGNQARLVHGSWHGPKAEERISHAWVELPGGFIWEPIHAAIFPGESLRKFARMWDERTYDYDTARRMIRMNNSYGPWHERRYP